MRLSHLLASLVVAASSVPGPATAQNAALEVVTDIPLAGGPTRLDLQSFDESKGLLFIAHPGSSMVHVVDTQRNRVVADISDLAGVHGVVAVPELGKVFATETAANWLAVIDERTFKVIARIPTAEGPDALTYAARGKSVFVSCKTGDSVIDAVTLKRYPDISLGGEVANTRFDATASRIYANVQPLDTVVEIDPVSRRVLARHPMPAGMHNHGMALDERRRLAFVAGAGNGRLAVLDLETWQVLAEHPVGHAPDVVAYDQARGRVYVACESGVVSTFQLADRSLVKVGGDYVAEHAHTIAVDPITHRLLLPLDGVEGRAVLRILEPADSPVGGGPRRE